MIEVAIQNDMNANLFFRPIGRSIRGRFDYLKVKETLAREKLDSFPEGIPGQRLAINPQNGEAFVIEPLHSPEHAELKSKLEKSGYSFAPAREKIETPHVPSWLFWLKRAIESGLAKLVAGRIPETIEGKPRRDFLHPERKPSKAEKQQQRMLAFMVAKLSPAERKAFDDFMAADTED